MTLLQINARHAVYRWAAYRRALVDGRCGGRSIDKYTCWVIDFERLANHLPRRQTALLIERFCIGRTQTEAARQLGCCIRTIQYLEVKALDTLGLAISDSEFDYGPGWVRRVHEAYAADTRQRRHSSSN